MDGKMDPSIDALISRSYPTPVNCQCSNIGMTYVASHGEVESSAVSRLVAGPDNDRPHESNFYQVRLRTG